MTVKIQLRRDTSANWSSVNPILSLGEPGFETDTNKLKLGDGVSTWTSLNYITPDFINIVSAGGIADLTQGQQDQIVEGTIVLTNDGVRWVYTGSGSKILEASYIQLADISPAWIQITSKPNSLVGLGDIASTASGDFILASGNNIYYVASFAESVDDRVGSLVIGGTGININYNDGGNSLTVAVSGLISNPADNRILTSSNNNIGINAESNLTFDGSSLIVTGDITSNYIYSELDGTVILPCKNNTVSTINIGTPVYISGHFANGKVYVAPADASDSAKMPAVGLLGSTLTSGSEGHVHIFGSLKLDTTGLGYTDPTDVGKTLYVASGGGLTLTRPTSETVLVQNIARLARIHNNGKYIILGPGRSNDVPNSINSYKLDIDNIRIDGNTLSSTDANGDIILTPNGAGQIILGKQNSASDPQELSYANGRFSSDGDARFSSYVLMRTTTSSGWNSLYLDYSTNADSDISITNTTSTFVINISGRASNGDSAGFVVRGCVKNISGAVSLVGSPVIESFLDSNFATANVQILTSGTGLVIQVDQGSSGVSGTIKWVASVQMSRLTY